MADERTRSEYRLSIHPGLFNNDIARLVAPSVQDREGLAQLMLDAYRGSIDDEGETFDDALEAVDYYLGHCEVEHSMVLKRDEAPIAMSLVAIVGGVYYIDPVAVSADHKRSGLGLRMVQACLTSLAQAGVTQVGAAITDGNEPSERLFASLGATRIGPWPPVG